MLEQPRYPLTADLAGVLETARQERGLLETARQEQVEESGRLLAWLSRLVRRPAAEHPLDSAFVVR